MPARIEGLNTVLANIRNIIPAEVAKMNARIANAGNIVETVVKEQASLTDHTLKQLAEMGHPYSTRYPVDSGPHPDAFVHKQSGMLYNNIEKEEDLNDTYSTVAVGVSEEKVPYVRDLITGTSRQRPRNFLGGAFRDHLDEIAAVIKGG